MASTQLLLNLPSSQRPEALQQRQLRLALKRAVLKWFLDCDPPHRPVLGVDVPTRGTSARVDVAAAWLDMQRTKLSDGRMGLITTPRKTAVVLCAIDRTDCWPECKNPENVARGMKSIRQRMHEQEAVIRQQEPELRDSNMLFEEYASWNYNASKNKEYRKLTSQLTHLETALYKGSRLARICDMHAAENVYLAVPAGLMSPDEILDSWGLLEIDPDTMMTTLRKEPRPLTVLHETMDSLVVSIADANTRNTLEAYGIRLFNDQPPVLVKMPTRHRRQAK